MLTVLHDDVVRDFEAIAPEGLRKQIREQSRTIWSVNPCPVHFGETSTVKKSVPAPPDGYSATKVFGRIYCEHYSASDEGGVKIVPTNINAITADETAQDLVAREGIAGLFLTEGDAPPTKAELEAANAKLTAYFTAVYQRAAQTWEQSKHNPLHISDMGRHAAAHLHKLGHISILPEWAQAVAAHSLEECERCGSRKRANFPVCPQCSWDKQLQDYAGAPRQVAAKK